MSLQKLIGQSFENTHSRALRGRLVVVGVVTLPTIHFGMAHHVEFQVEGDPARRTMLGANFRRWLRSARRVVAA